MTNRDCDLCHTEIAKEPCTHALVTDEQVTMSRKAWDGLASRLAHAEADAAAMREIVRAVANTPTYRAESGSLAGRSGDLRYVFTVYSHSNLVEKARALLAEEVHDEPPG